MSTLCLASVTGSLSVITGLGVGSTGSETGFIALEAEGDLDLVLAEPVEPVLVARAMEQNTLK